MQKPIFFEHEIVNQGNMEFLTDSMQTVIGQNLSLFTNGEAGIANGLQLTGLSLATNFYVSPGVAYTSLGERLELFSGTYQSIPFTSGTQNIYAKLNYLNYNPELGPSSTVTQFNPDTLAPVAVENYNGIIFTTASGDGTDTVLLGTLTASGGAYVSSDTSTAQTLKLAGFFDISTQTLDGSIIEAGTIDSTSFKSGLTATIILNTGVSILNASTGNYLGSLAYPFENVYTRTITSHQADGMSPIIIDSLQMKTGTSIESTSGKKLSIDSSGNGTTFGATIFTTGISVLQAGNLSITTPSGNISLQTGSGSVYITTPGGSLNVSNGIAMQGSLVVGGSATFTSGISFGTGGNLDFTNLNVTISQDNFSTKNLIANSDFSMGIPTYYTGTVLEFNSPLAGLSNFKSGMTVLSPWEPRYSGSLTPYNWTTSGATFILGTAESNSAAVGQNEKQYFVFNTPTPASGTFNITYTGISVANWPAGPAGSGTATGIAYNIAATGLQTLLENFSNIGVGNISVSGTYLTGYTLEFTSGLGFKNLPLISISSSVAAGNVPPVSSGTNSIVPNPPTLLQDGLTPTSFYSIYKDPTAYTTVGVGSFTRVTAAALTTAAPAVWATEIESGKPNRQYGVSLYYKNGITTPSDSYLSLQAGIFENAIGSGTGTFVSFSKTNNLADWQRLNATLTAPPSSGSLYLVFKAQPSGAASLNTLFDVTAVQLTEGPNLVSYNNNSTTAFTMYDPKITTDNYSNGGWGVHDTAAMRRYVKTITASPYCIISGSFYSPGAIVNISAEYDCYNAGESFAYLILDSQSNAIAARYVGATVWHPMKIEKSFYVPRGNHSVSVWSRTAAGDNYTGVRSLLGEAGSMSPKISITF